VLPKQDTGTLPTGKLCDPCQKKEDCGGSNDYCLFNSATGEKMCGQDCSGTTSCPAGYKCLHITGNVDVYQCVPISETCKNPQPPVQDAGPPAPPGICGNSLETEVFNRVNQERTKQGLKTLNCDSIAAQVAHQYSQYMCNAGFFSHFGPDGSTPSSRLKAAGATFIGCGENIAAGQPTPQMVMQSWMNSSGHKANILSTKWSHIGVGYVSCSGGMKHYWTQDFLKK